MPAQATRSGTDRRQTPAISRRVCLHSEKKTVIVINIKVQLKAPKPDSTITKICLFSVIMWGFVSAESILIWRKRQNERMHSFADINSTYLQIRRH